MSITDALRGLLVVSRRIAAEDMTKWVKSELEGYPEDERVPIYRRGGRLPISLRFDGPGGFRDTMRVMPSDLPRELQPSDSLGDLIQPIAELAALASNDEGKDPALQMPMAWIGLYREFASKGQAPSMAMMNLNNATMVIPQTLLIGMIDRVKSFALDLVLDLEGVSLEAGAPGGPTVETSKALASAVTINFNQVYAANSTVAVGQNASVTQLTIGDVSGLLEAARALLTEDGVTALSEALEKDGGEPAAETRDLLDRVKTGAYALTTGLATNGAYDGLVALLGAVFPGFGG
ncbi:hypothetical protein BJ958_002792 [Nocardioides kongjuensis]|uniref:AbiTii domain-containing protein n=1 Tax=Nocardioides kongjuensis TaxID=349522 RepID=A0A852RPS6_9ACTN|nr:hypothetical protein [Nocardioides kongjuensis]